MHPVSQTVPTLTRLTIREWVSMCTDRYAPLDYPAVAADMTSKHVHQQDHLKVIQTHERSLLVQLRDLEFALEESSTVQLARLNSSYLLLQTYSADLWADDTSIDFVNTAFVTGISLSNTLLPPITAQIPSSSDGVKFTSWPLGLLLAGACNSVLPF